MDEKFDVILQKMREADAGGGGGGDLPIGIKADYSAFEVYANDATIPAGSTAIADFVVDGVGPAVDIPAGMTHRCKFKTLGGKLIVDWGDGTIVTKDDTAPDGSWEEEHTYSAAGKYLVKVYGAFSRIQTVSGKNLVHRVLDFDLPVAATHTNLQEFAANALRLVAVRFNDQLPPDRFGNILGTFTGCPNLRKVTGMDRIGVCNTVSQIFKGCPNLASCAFVLPPAVVLSSSGANGYRGAFYDTANRVQALSGDLASFFPDRGFTADEVDLTQLFYNYRPGVKYPNITLSDAGAAKLAKVLWESGERFIARSTVERTETSSGDTYMDGIFRCFPAAVRAKIPVWWGGTMIGVYCDPATGSVPKWQGVNYRAKIYVVYDYAPISASVAGASAILPHVDRNFLTRIDATNCNVSLDTAFNPSSESVGDIEFYGGTFAPYGDAAATDKQLSFCCTVIPSGGFTGVGETVVTLDHCFCAAYFDGDGQTRVNVVGGTVVAPGGYGLVGIFSLTDNAVVDYTAAVGSVATIIYTAGCTINGEVKVAGGTIVLN